MKNNVITLFPTKPASVAEPFKLAAGSSVLPRSFRQAVNTSDEMRAIAMNAAEGFNDEMTRIARALRLDLYNPGVKTAARITQKAEAEKGGKVDQIMDPLRCSLIGKAPQLARALKFFAPSNNSHVLSIENQFGVPCSESGIRRAKILYALPTAETSSGFLITEIQLRHPGMRDALDETDRIYRRKRSIDAMMSTTSDLAYKTAAQMQRQSADLQQSRFSVNFAAAAKTDLHKLEETRVYGIKSGLPFVAIETPLDRAPTILRPDIRSGTYVVDNALFPAFNRGAYAVIEEGAFFAKSQQLVIKHEQDVARARHLG